MNEQIKHVYISPHLDDAVCSCGGLIHSQAARGEAMLVVSLFTHGIEDADALPPYLRAVHNLWGFNDADPFAARREEDIAAMHRLGANYLHMGWRGALYRQARDERFLYAGLSYFGSPVKEDIRTLAQIRRLLLNLRQQYPNAIFYAPLGVGGHVDHNLTHRAARLVPGPMRFYEDIPYVFLGKVSPFLLRMLAITARLGLRAGNFSGGKQTNTLIASIPSRTSFFAGPQLRLVTTRRPTAERWQGVLHPIDLRAKFDTLLLYASQIPMLFGSSDWAWHALENYATAIARSPDTAYERQWKLSR